MTKAAKPDAKARLPLTRKAVLDTALKIVDEAGLDALTIRAIARELGVYPNAVHWHVGSRTNLVGAVASRLFDEITLPDPRKHTWDEWLEVVARQWRDAMHQHPNIAMVAGTHLVTTTGAMPIVERILSVLLDAGFEDESLVDAYNAFVGFVLGWLTVELSREPENADRGWKDEFEEDLDQLDPNTFPALTSAMPRMRNAAFLTRWDSGRQQPMAGAFDAALTVLISGLRASVPKR
ncbi:hypothetical protein GCM10010191_21500 [Actinomadura vinacea]|uniref:HTH tetR-type domain-containing protein n=1 Tax=Actinomadura vinacea TaxID=115336 RepID=A0ABN3ISH8_9ACTN